MNPRLFLKMLSFFCLLYSQSFAQADNEEQLNLPGDNLNLYAVMKVFQESPTLESFEKSLNDESQKINNLDLNGDGKIDYITVEDSMVNALHNITLRVALNANEEQNVAVIAVEKDNAGKVTIQLIGDEDLYGKDYIVEPDDTASGETPNPGYSGSNVPDVANNAASAAVNPTIVQFNSWPVIRYIFVPSYTGWYSPWHWGYYPTYWRPWKPYYWHYYYGYHYHWNYFYLSHYCRWPAYRIPGWQNIYYTTGFRHRSVIVQRRITGGNYRQTYTRPAMAENGAAAFRKDFPKAPSANLKLPSFDDKGRPVKKPLEPGGANTRPVVTRPVTRPITKPVTRPVTKPISKPISKPVTRPATRPVVKPVHPITKPVIQKPVTRPVQPSTKPVQPSARPVIRQ